jgi:hypothetical protein
MIEWIRAILDPPGTERKNTGSIFSFIGRVGGIVRDDAVKAHNAHFPYLADMEKLRQHAKALMIPELENDTEKLFRDRVAAASFYLSKAGERGFIMDQLEGRFGDRFAVVEKFLQLRVKLINMSEKEKNWTLALLDSLIDPNVYLELTEWFRLRDRVRYNDAVSKIKIRQSVIMDGYHVESALDELGFLKLAQSPIRDKFFTALKFDGSIRHNGKYQANASYDKLRAILKPAGMRDSLSAKDYMSSRMRPAVLRDTVTAKESQRKRIKAAVIKDSVKAKDARKAKAKPSTLRDSVKSKDALRLGIRYHHYHDGTFKADGSIKFNSGILLPL